MSEDPRLWFDLWEEKCKNEATDEEIIALAKAMVEADAKKFKAIIAKPFDLDKALRTLRMSMNHHMDKFFRRTEFMDNCTTPPGTYTQQCKDGIKEIVKIAADTACAYNEPHADFGRHYSETVLLDLINMRGWELRKCNGMSDKVVHLALEAYTASFCCVISAEKELAKGKISDEYTYDFPSDDVNESYYRTNKEGKREKIDGLNKLLLCEPTGEEDG